ncbi:MAG TPA: NADH-quinone oxidoreductase subunit C [Phycisphaerae bacterium]|nr:NADH-quinone oxidoreductase subunit C [Phycisphaerae bacterium]
MQMTEATTRILKKLKQKFPGIDFVPAPLLARDEKPTDQTYVRVGADRLSEVMRFLHDDPELFFDQLCDLTCVDYLEFPDATDRFGVTYSLLSIKHGHRLWVKCFVNDPEPTVPSVVNIWHGADWLEREVWDLFGVRFEGHPDLRRIVTWEGFEAHPLRKDYPLRGRGERDQYPVVHRESTDVRREKIETPMREGIEN